MVGNYCNMTVTLLKEGRDLQWLKSRKGRLIVHVQFFLLQ